MGLPYRSARESHRKGYKWWASVIHLFAVALLVAGSLRLPHPVQPDKSEDNFLGRTAVPRYQQQPELSCPLQAHWSCSKSIREVSTPTERISPDFQQVRLRLTTTQPVSALLLLLAREYKQSNGLSLLQGSYSLCESVRIHTGNTTTFLISIHHGTFLPSSCEWRLVVCYRPTNVM